MVQNYKYHLMASSCFLSLLAAGPTLAANDAPVATASASSSSSIQEIVVTANRRKQNIQTVPLAVQAFSAALAKHEGITDAQSLADMVPGLTFNRVVSLSIPYLRGVGESVGQAGDEPSVAYYVDDVYIPSGAASLSNFNDLDRIEVDKGPQGTLFGRNATGGTIQVFTKDPTREPTADIELGYANYNTKSGSIYASSGLTSKLAANIAVYGSQQLSGWGTNLYTGRPTDLGWDYGGRIKFLFKPSDDTSFLVTLDHDSTGTAQGDEFHTYPGTKAGIGGVPGFTTTAFTNSNPSDYYDIDANLDPGSVTRQSGVSVKATHDFQWARLVNVTAFRQTNFDYRLDDDGGTMDLVDATVPGFDRTWTEELQLLSPKDSPLTWIGGLYYFNDITGYNNLHLYGNLEDALGYSSTVQYSDSYSGFGQATATILPDTHLTAGLRYTIDERTVNAYGTFLQSGGGPLVNANAADSPQSKRWPKLTYRFSLDHQFTPGLMGYVAYNRGFKSGTFNDVVVEPGTIGQAVQPETLDAYTIGAKTEWFDHRLRFNTEAFWYQYKNIQINIVGSNDLSTLANAAAATIKGIDLDLQATPIEHLTLTASAEIMDGHYDSFPAGVLNTYDPATGGSIQSAQNQKGNHTIQTPPFSFDLSANYLIPLNQYGTLALNFAWSHSGNYYADSDNGQGQLSSNDDRQPIFNLINLSTNWTSENGIWGISLWGKNITGEKYWSFSEEDGLQTLYSAAPPATFGVTATYHFGA